MGVPAAPAHSCSSTSNTGARLKREDFTRTRHDSAFSPWKILIGASDWKDHSMGEGVEKYRTQNLPDWNPSPGVYELGIAVTSGRDARRLDSSSVVPVYLGQAENLRTRLQQYGRDGAHLENGCLNKKSTNGLSDPSHKGHGLFTDIFAKGFPIVYRCATMTSKKDAEMIEKQLLDTFDYAWNKGSNGVRRHADICKKLDGRAKASQFSLLVKKVLSFNQKQVGIKIRTCNPDSLWNHGLNLSDTYHSSIPNSQVFGIRRVMMPPHEVHYRSFACGVDICGVAIGHESICTASPVRGRKRCAVHKGMSVNGHNSGSSNKEEKAACFDARMGASLVSDQHRIDFSDYSTDICGVRQGHGSVCRAIPVKGRKRCAIHKGMRADGCIQD